MWVRSSAIRPVPPYATVSQEMITRIEDRLGEDETRSEKLLSDAFDRFESTQPALARRVGKALTRTDDEVALALGYFLGLVVWLTFEEAFGARLQTVDATAADGVDELLTLDEELRGGDPQEPLDSDDVVAMEQPDMLRFVQEHIDAALETHAQEVDVDAVHRIYRLILIELLALSYAVSAPADYAGGDTEIYA